jgi:hypothetical protein
MNVPIQFYHSFVESQYMSMADELSRYATMRDFPMFISVSPLTISKAGFFHIGNGCHSSILE